MKSNTAMVRCCRKKLHKGRSLFALIMDYIALRAVIFGLCYMWFGANISNDTAKFLLSAVTAVFISAAIDLANSLRLDSLIKKERSLASEAELNRRISLLTDKERNNIIGRHIAANRESFGDDKLLCSVCRPSGVTADDVIKAVRTAKERGAQSIAFFYSGSISHGAETQAYGIDDMPLEFISLRRILSAEDLCHLTPTRDETDALVIAEAAEAHKQRKGSLSAPLSPVRIRRYILSAASLTAISFFVENSVYFRITAAACILMGAAAWWTNRASA